jgi:UDP-N-acetylmuramoyl-tripeptide--D-alanyl-D-alanine ligase
VLNADDPRVAAFAEGHAGRSIFYGLSANAEVRASAIEYLEEGVRFRCNVAGEVLCGVPGPAGVWAALAALAATQAAGIDPASVHSALAGLRPGPMRAGRVLRGGITVWNDCYNSNPEAARMMLDLLVSTPASRRIAVMGEMLELGRWSKALHEEVGNHAASCGVSVLVGIRGAARHLVDAAREAGLAADAASFFEDPRQAGQYVRGIARAGDAILFKGSRGTHVEAALNAFWGEE